MIDTFENRIKRLEDEITALKSARYRSSANTPTETKETTVQTVIRGYTDSQGNKSTFPVNEGHIAVSMAEGGFVSFAVKTDSGDRTFMAALGGTSDGRAEYIVEVESGSLADAQELDGNPNRRKTIPITVQITATNEFTVQTWLEP